LLGRERLGALQQLLEARERRPLTRPVCPVGPDEIPDPRGPFEPKKHAMTREDFVTSRRTHHSEWAHIGALVDGARVRREVVKILEGRDAGRR